MATALAASPNNNILAVGTSTAEIYLFVWDGRAQAASVPNALQGTPANGATPIACSPSPTTSGSIHAALGPAGAAGRNAGVWRQFGRSFKGQFGVTTALSFSASGTLLAAAASDATVRIWHLATGDLVAVLERHRDVVTGLCFNPQSENVLVTTSLDGTVRAWDIGLQAAMSSPQASPLRPPGAAPALPLGPAGGPQLLANAAGKLRRRLRSVTKSLHKWGGGFGRVNSAAFSPSGQCLAVACTNGVWLWGDGVQEVHGSEGMWLHGKDVTAVAFSPKGDYLAAAMWDRAERAAVVLMDTATWAIRAILEGQPGQDHTIFQTTPLVFSRDGGHIACSLVGCVPLVHEVDTLPSVEALLLAENVSLAGYGLEVDCAVRALLDSTMPASAVDTHAASMATLYNDEMAEGELMDLMLHALSTEDE